MNNILLLLIGLIVLGVSLYLYNPLKENFTEQMKLEYSDPNNVVLYKQAPPAIMGPSFDQGVVNGNPSHPKMFEYGDNVNIDNETFLKDAANINLKFGRTYMLDPSGDLLQHDLTQNTFSTECCPPQYAPPFKLSTACAAPQHTNSVANNYSGMSLNSNAGCACISPAQAKFISTRGGNTGVDSV